MRNIRLLLCSAGIFLSLASTAHAAELPELRCRRSIQAELSKWLKSTLKARLACQRDVILGLQPASTDCATGEGSRALENKISEATARLTARLESTCAGANWPLLSYPGPCEGQPEPFGPESLAACFRGLAGETISELFDVWYPVTLDAFGSAEIGCLKTIPKRAAAMVLRELDARLNCLLGFEAAGGQTSIDCRGQLVPYGSGTGSPDLDKLIHRAQRAWLGGMPTACSRIDLDEFGFGENCPEIYDTGSPIADLHACVFHANRLEVPALLNLAFPTDAVCGNGIRQEGEECDNGQSNSDTTSDACREDCLLPICGDGTADTGGGETCDDANSVDLDGCTPECVLEFCGDGTVNDLPSEDCDDGNSNPNDRCTGDCQDASCGDGVVCNAAACTSGPAGGPELCDLGAGNSASGLCKPDCSGFTRSCELTIGITNSVNLGAVTYDFSYKDADGEVLGTGSTVQCTSIVTGGLVSFFDNETKRAVRESLIVDAGVQTPLAIARCNYATNDPGLAAGDFKLTVEAASNPNFEPITVTLAVTNVDCD